MARNNSLLLLLILLASLVGCASTAPGPKPEAPSSAIQQYDQNSWKQMIPASCQAYFDGCNNCRRNPENGSAACTRKACAVYAKPYCLTDKATAAETDGTPMAQTVKYVCDGGKSFTVSYGEYRSGDQRLKLKQDQVMFSDHQSHTAMPLERVRSV